MTLRLGRIAEPHDLRGETAIATDAAATRAVPAKSLDIDAAGLVPLDLLPHGSAADLGRELLGRLAALSANERDALSVAVPRWLPPVERPGKILCLAGNYPKHVAERGYRETERAKTFPYVFMKPTATMIGGGDSVVLPAVSPSRIDYECELAIVVGRRAKSVSEADALACVAGYTVVNDISDRGFRPNPGREERERDKFFDWLHGKWHDTFCPVGPVVLSSDHVAHPAELALSLDVSGDRRQAATAGEMIFPVPAIVAFVSSWMTLEPGDIIATGTPSGVGAASETFLKPGDELAAAIEGIGVLKNPVTAEVSSK